MVDMGYFNDLLFNIMVYIVPVIFYLRYKEKVGVFTYLKLKDNALNGILMGIAVSIIFIIFLLLKDIFIGFDKVNLDIGIFWISGFLVGFLEEIPFRGFLLQKMSEYMSFWKANILTTMIFVSMHIPVWINSNKPILETSIRISCSSLALGYLLKRYKSLWTPIICHSVYDLCFWIGL